MEFCHEGPPSRVKQTKEHLDTIAALFGTVWQHDRYFKADADGTLEETSFGVPDTWIKSRPRTSVASPSTQAVWEMQIRWSFLSVKCSTLLLPSALDRCSCISLAGTPPLKCSGIFFFKPQQQMWWELVKIITLIAHYDDQENWLFPMTHSESCMEKGWCHWMHNWGTKVEKTQAIYTHEVIREIRHAGEHSWRLKKVKLSSTGQRLPK